jgi:hypothetical protein
MDWKRVADQAKQVINKRGGSESLKEDAEELRDIAEGPGTLSEKAKRAAEAIREPGGNAGAGTPAGPGEDRVPDADSVSAADSVSGADSVPDPDSVPDADSVSEADPAVADPEPDAGAERGGGVSGEEG